MAYPPIKRKPRVTLGGTSVLHSTVAGVEIRLTSTNRFYCTYKERTAFPYLYGSTQLKFDDSTFTVPKEAFDKIQELLLKQTRLRMSKQYQADLEDEKNEELWKFTDEV